MKFDEWLDTFISEKGIDLNEIVKVTGPSGQVYSIPLESIIDGIKGAPEYEQVAIKEVLVKIDLSNAKISGYLAHLAQAIAI